MDFGREPNNRRIQMDDQAGHTKLTAVTIGTAQGKKQFFVPLQHNARGEAILPMAVLDRLLSQSAVRRGDTYSVA